MFSDEIEKTNDREGGMSERVNHVAPGSCCLPFYYKWLGFLLSPLSICSARMHCALTVCQGTRGITRATAGIQARFLCVYISGRTALTYKDLLSVVEKTNDIRKEERE